MDNNNYCIIMAGGLGTRFWPMSRTVHPKQFIDILGVGETLIQQTFKRFLQICPLKNIFIVTNEKHKYLVKEQIPEIIDSQILCEPSRRNTAPCVAYASYKIASINPNANIIVAPSDHLIMKEDVFTDILTNALKATSKNNWLLTLGIKPSRPNTGYGYIQFNEALEYSEIPGIYKVKTFTEKPVLEMAKQFLESGDFLWNSGIFIWSLKSILEAFELHLPEINTIFKEGLEKYDTPEEEEFIKQAYTVCKNISIDYGIMEKAENVYVFSSEFGWSDIGTWGSLYEIRSKDEHQNSIVGKKVLYYNSNNCIVHMPKDKLVVIQGLDDYIVVEDDNILLICKKSEEQQIREFVNDVKIEIGEQFI